MATTTQASAVGRHNSSSSSRRSRRPSAPSRVRVVAEVTALLLIAMLLVAIPILSRSGDSPVATTSEVKLEQGDTLWSVAESHPIEGFTTAEAVELIASMNGIKTATIAAGSTIEVPGDAGATELALK